MNIIRIRIFKLIAAIIFGIVIIVLGFKWMKSHLGGHSHHHHHHHHHEHQPPTNTAKLTMNDVSPNWKFRPQFLSDNTTNKLNQTAKIPQIIHQVFNQTHFKAKEKQLEHFLNKIKILPERKIEGNAPKKFVNPQRDGSLTQKTVEKYRSTSGRKL